MRKSGLTFAAEAGTQRLRDVINKNVTWEQIERGCRIAFSEGYTSVKLYFMMGLPTETMEDIKGIADTAQQVVDLFLYHPRPSEARASGHISVACFVLKPDTRSSSAPRTAANPAGKAEVPAQLCTFPQDQGQHHDSYQRAGGRLRQG